MLQWLADRLNRPVVIAWLAYFTALEVLSWLTTSPGFGPCLISPDENDNPGEYDEQHSCPTFFVGSLILLGRFDRFIEHHDKGIVAAFTVVLAISTIGLWRSTARLWHETRATGERQIRDTEILERAYISVEGFGIGPM